jgi:hypothetical protein
MRDEALTYAKNHQTEALTALQELLCIPSISMSPEHAGDIQ